MQRWAVRMTEASPPWMGQGKKRRRSLLVARMAMTATLASKVQRKRYTIRISSLKLLDLTQKTRGTAKDLCMLTISISLKLALTLL